MSSQRESQSRCLNVEAPSICCIFAFASVGQPCVIDDWIGTYGFGPFRCAWRRIERLAVMLMYCTNSQKEFEKCLKTVTDKYCYLTNIQWQRGFSEATRSSKWSVYSWNLWICAEAVIFVDGFGPVHLSKVIRSIREGWFWTCSSVQGHPSEDIRP